MSTTSATPDPLTVEAHSVVYNRMKGSWPRCDLVEVVIAGADCKVDPIKIPMPFLQQSGDNTWGLVSFISHQLVNEEGVVCDAETGIQLNLSEAPVAGTVLFKPSDLISGFTWRRGPEGANAYRAPRPDEGWEGSTVSGASETNTSFREALILRDGVCLVTQKPKPVQASHLVPKQRLDLYRTLLGQDYSDPFQPECGVLLSNDAHGFFDRFTWSFYHKNGKLFVHSFTQLLEYHGREISLLALKAHGFNSVAVPDTRLIAWHYAQCCMMRFRGSSARMAVNAQ